VWDLYQECQTLHKSPSQRLRLEPRFSAATAYDFDGAVRLMGRAIERALQLTDRVEADPDPKPSTGRIWKDEPRYTLNDLLWDSTEHPEAEDEFPEEFLHLPAAQL
jgi:hypothetical protein